jgi:hypothetical protein
MKKDLHDNIYLNEADLLKIKDLSHKAWTSVGSRDGDLQLSKSYVIGIINFLVSNKIIDNLNIKFGEPGQVNNEKS